MGFHVDSFIAELSIPSLIVVHVRPSVIPSPPDRCHSESLCFSYSSAFSSRRYYSNSLSSFIQTSFEHQLVPASVPPIAPFAQTCACPSPPPRTRAHGRARRRAAAPPRPALNLRDRFPNSMKPLLHANVPIALIQATRKIVGMAIRSVLGVSEHCKPPGRAHRRTVLNPPHARIKTMRCVERAIRLHDLEVPGST